MTQSINDNSDWRRLYPFASHWADVADGRLHYVDEGSNVGRTHLSVRPEHPPHENGEVDGQKCPSYGDSTLLFVHGNPTWSFHWRRLVLALRDKIRCVAIDHLGCGLSDKPAKLLTLNDHIANLTSLVERLNLERITLVAQDWGGAIGLGAMLRMRERLERIVLFNTGAFPPRYIPWRIRACRIPVLGRLGVQGANLFSLAALRMTLARRKKLESAIAAGYLAPYDSWSHRRAVYGFVRDIPPTRGRVSPRREIESQRDSPTWGSTAATLSQIELDLPTLADRPSCLIWGMRDWCFRPDCLDRFLAAWPNATVHQLSDVGHWVVEDAPEESLRYLSDFLATNATAASAAVSTSNK